MSADINQPLSPKQRMPIFDNARGIIVFILLVYFFFSQVRHPCMLWILHGPGHVSTLYLADLGAVAFMITLSLLLSRNFKEKYEKMGKKAYFYYINRAILLMGLGFAHEHLPAVLESVISGTLAGPRIEVRWMVLQTFAFATLFGIPFLRLNRFWRLGIGVVLIFIHQLVLLQIEPVRAFISTHSFGGFLGVPAWLGMLLISTAIGDMYYQNKKQFYITASSFISLGVVLYILNQVLVNGIVESAPFSGSFAFSFEAFLWMNWNLITLSYFFGGLAFTLAVFIILNFIPVFKRKTVPYIGWIGKSSLFYFFAGGFLAEIIKFFGEMINENFRRYPSWWEILVTAILYFGIFALIGWALHKKNINISARFDSKPASLVIPVAKGLDAEIVATSSNLDIAKEADTEVVTASSDLDDKEELGAEVAVEEGDFGGEERLDTEVVADKNDHDDAERLDTQVVVEEGGLDGADSEAMKE